MKSKVSVKINQGAVEHLYQEIAKKVEGADQSVRAACTGKSVGEIVPVARDRFAEIGINFPDATLREYAGAVSNDVDFKFVLK